MKRTLFTSHHTLSGVTLLSSTSGDRMRHIGIPSALGMAVTAVAVMTAAAQTPAQKPAFEVASIKEAVFPSDAYFAGWSAAAGCNPARLSISGNRVTVSKMSLCSLITGGYDIRDYLISGAPDWIMKADRSLYYEIQATAPDTVGTLTPERAREMLQTLLADRFQLKAHWEMKEVPVYALVVGKNGRRFKLSSTGPCAQHPNAAVAFSMSSGPGGQRRGGGSLASCKGATAMQQLAQSLSRDTDRPIVDRTGIEGGQVFELDWAGDGPNQSDAPSLFTAVQEQLGLKLDATRAAESPCDRQGPAAIGKLNASQCSNCRGRVPDCHRAKCACPILPPAV
jgi:uncharacterized protein (TIGR03435 family)